MKYHYIIKPKEGLKHCGDGVIILEEDEYTRFILVDSLGHGERAQRVVDKVKSLKNDLRHDRPSSKLRLLHRELRETRGAAVSIADIYESEFIWCAIGNVDVKVNDKDINPINNSGIVGYKVRKIKQRPFNVKPGTLIIIYSDGISSRFSIADDVPVKKEVEEIARFMIENYRKSKDDSTVMVIRI